MTITIKSEKELEKVVTEFLKFSNDVKIAFLHGDLGAGKTTFVKKLVSMLDSEEEASSPTYTLVNEYALPEGRLYHIDLYRLNDTHEAQDMGIEEYFDNDAWCFVEWPDKVQNLLPLESSVIKLTINEDGTRTLELN